MATYDSLTDDEKGILAEWEASVRGWTHGTIAKGIIEARALKASLDASGMSGEILDTLDASELVPNSTALAGASALTRAQWDTLRSAMNAFLTTYDTVATRQVLAKSAGPRAGLE